MSFRQQKEREKAMAASSRLSLEQLFSKIQEGKIKDLPLILKADVSGSIEVLSQALKRLSNEKVKISLLHAGVGAININDVLLASASGAIIVGFNVRPEKKAAEEAEKVGVEIRLHTVIYNVTDEIKKAMEGLLDPTLKEVARGRAEVRNTFKVPKFGVVAGCYVTEGIDPALGAGAPAARQPGDLRGQGRLAAPLQGRRLGGQAGLRVRHRPRPVPGRQGRRHHRGVPGREGRRGDGLRPSATGDPRVRRRAASGTARHLSMVIAYAVFDLHLPGCRGLKEKRMIVRSLKTRIRNEFEVSAAEVGDQDLLQRAELGVAAVGPDQAPLDALLQGVLRFVEENLDGEILEYRNEFIHV